MAKHSAKAERFSCRTFGKLAISIHARVRVISSL
jgi:hypothetical protein